MGTMTPLDSAEDLQLLRKLHAAGAPTRPICWSKGRLRATSRQDSAEAEYFASAGEPRAGGESPCPAAESPDPGRGAEDAASRWDATTQALVACSTLPFMFLLLPQVRVEGVSMGGLGKATVQWTTVPADDFPMTGVRCPLPPSSGPYNHCSFHRMQILKNAANLRAGNAAALSALSYWVRKSWEAAETRDSGGGWGCSWLSAM